MSTTVLLLVGLLLVDLLAAALLEMPGKEPVPTSLCGM